MKIGLITDIHANSSQERLVQIKNTLDYCASVFEARGVKTVINLGDWNDTSLLSSYNEFLALSHYVRTFKKFNNYFLLGNHDIMSSSDLSYSIWDVVKSMDNPRFEIVDKYQSLLLGKWKVGLLPYSEDRDLKQLHS